MSLKLGQTYDREEIRQIVGGGSLQSYLPQLHGTILCGCFDQKLNKSAPTEIDAGAGPRVISGAKLLAAGNYAIPVFLKRTGNSWEYVGDYKCKGFSEDKKDLYPNVPTRRPDAVLVFYLERVFSDLQNQAPADLFSQEGNLALRTHFVRERDPSLVSAKKGSFIAEHGQLICGVCGLREDMLPSKAGRSCFEVHHLSPIGQRSEAGPTRLADLLVVCANCHRMLHSAFESMTVDDLRIRMAKKRG